MGIGYELQYTMEVRVFVLLDMLAAYMSWP